MRIGSAAARLIATIATAAAVVSATPASARDTLVIGVAQFPASLHPNIGSQTTQFYTIGFAIRPITTIDVHGTLICLLCTELPTLANGLARLEDQPGGGHGLAVTLKLRPELRWGDGVPVTTRDLEFTWRVGRDPAAGFANSHPWQRATRLDVIDAHTAVLHLDRTLTSYNEWDQLLSEHIDGPIYSRTGGTPGDYVNQTAYNAAPLTPGLWNGPYVIAAYRSNAEVEFAPNPYWPGAKPGFPHLVVKLLENTAALQANLLSGDVDMAPAGIGLTIDQVVAMQAAQPTRFTYTYNPAPNYEHIDLQNANPILQDVRVRRALLHAIDVAAIVARLFAGHAEIARTFINDLDPNFDPEALPSYPFDPARARALLTEAGWTPGPDGIRRNAAGVRLSLEFASTSGNRIRELTQAVMQNQWKAVGVEIQIRNQPSRTFFGQLMKHREYTGLAEYASTSEIGLVPSRRLGTEYIPTEANNWAGGNYLALNNKALDDAMAQAETELDPARQKSLWTTMQRIYSTELYALPLYYRSDPDITPTWLKGYDASGKEDYITFFAENWR